MLPALRGAIAALLILLAGCAPVRHYEAALVLQDFAAAEGDSRLKQTTAMPLRQSVTYTVAGRAHTADLYLPGALDGCVAPAAAESRKATGRGCPRAAIRGDSQKAALFGCPSCQTLTL